MRKEIMTCADLRQESEVTKSKPPGHAILMLAWFVFQIFRILPMRDAEARRCHAEAMLAIWFRHFGHYFSRGMLGQDAHPLHREEWEPLEGNHWEIK
jgi:hypothetical protein